MRISSSVLLCLLSASLVTGITLIDVPKRDGSNVTTDAEFMDVAIHNDTYSSIASLNASDSSSHSFERKLLRSVPKPAP